MHHSWSPSSSAKFFFSALTWGSLEKFTSWNVDNFLLTAVCGHYYDANTDHNNDHYYESSSNFYLFFFSCHVEMLRQNMEHLLNETTKRHFAFDRFHFKSKSFKKT